MIILCTDRVMHKWTVSGRCLQHGMALGGHVRDMNGIGARSMRHLALVNDFAGADFVLVKADRVDLYRTHK